MHACLRVAVLAMGCTLALSAQEPALPEVMRRVHTYVTDYEDHVLSGMVAQERTTSRSSRATAPSRKSAGSSPVR